MKTQIKNFLFGSINTDSKVFDWCYLLFRVYAGLSIADGAGLSKVFHKINEKGDESWSNLAFGTGDWFVKQVGDLGFTFISPTLWAYLAVYGEFIGGLLIAFGIYTRISSIQLAFQFFIVAFVWYDNPYPFLGMYYQQLIFWSFVMTFAVGDGKYSMATLISRKKKSIELSKPILATVCFLLIIFTSQAQTGLPSTETIRVSFTVKNPTLKNKTLDFKSYDSQSKMIAAYGYSLNAMATHATNMPAPTYVYEEKNGTKELLFVVTKADDGKTFSVTQEYEISREQYLDAANGEMKLKESEKVREGNSIENIAKHKGIKLVNVSIKGSSWMLKQVFIRYELPWGNDKAIGFSSTLSKFGMHQEALPVGTKVYQCSGNYWEKNSKHTEKLLLTVENDKDNSVTLQ
jgi:uncharacterized membrane protein YphA (DoxX/SURF4 family)